MSPTSPRAARPSPRLGKAQHRIYKSQLEEVKRNIAFPSKLTSFVFHLSVTSCPCITPELSTRPAPNSTLAWIVVAPLTLLLVRDRPGGKINPTTTTTKANHSFHGLGCFSVRRSCTNQQKLPSPPPPFPTLGVGQVIKGWDQGLTDMCVGEKRILTIPANLGYGSRSMGSAIPANSALVFDVELLRINNKDEL